MSERHAPAKVLPSEPCVEAVLSSRPMLPGPLLPPAKEPEDFVPRALCEECNRPKPLCLCAFVTPFATQTRVVLLQHPRESSVRIGTVRLLLLGLPNASLHVGLDFSTDTALEAALSNPNAPPILLFPGENAKDLEDSPPEGAVTLVVVDGTWWQANKLLKLNPRIANLPRYCLNPSEPSRYRIRRAPTKVHVSTIEAVVAALQKLEAPGRELLPLLSPFDAFVEQQLNFASQHQARRHLRKVERKRRPNIPEELYENRGALVIGYGEANTWPHSTPKAPPPQMIHWVAERLETGEFFEAYIRPRFPLSSAFFKHTGLSAEYLTHAEGFGDFKARWDAFLRPGDQLVGWGAYASSVLEQNGISAITRVDARELARGYLKEKLGDMHACAAKLGVPLKLPRTGGRAGERLTALTAVTQALVKLAEAAEK